MPLLRRCGYPRCGELSPNRYCPTHQEKKRADEQAFKQNRRDTEPWRFLYLTLEWTKCKKNVRARDGQRCTHVENGTRCTVTTMLAVHHQIPLATLWYRCNEDSGLLLLMGTNEDICTTLCEDHHKQADEKLRAEQQAFLDRERGYTAPARKKPRRRS